MLFELSDFILIMFVFFEMIIEFGNEITSLGHVRVFVTPWTMLARFLCLWNSPGKNTGVGNHSLL